MSTFTEQDNERWLDVLAGKTQATDLATRQAASLRRYFEHQAAEDLAQAPDPQAEKRMLNRLRARGAFDAAPAPLPAENQPGLLRRAVAWLLPPEGGHMGRYAAVATVAFAVITGPMLLRGAGEPLDDTSAMKGLPPPPPPLTPPDPALMGVLVMSAQPAQAAAQVVAVLTQAGIKSVLIQEGEDHLLRAQIPAAQVAELKQRLASLGLTIPTDGGLRLRFMPLP